MVWRITIPSKDPKHTYSEDFLNKYGICQCELCLIEMAKPGSRGKIGGLKIYSKDPNHVPIFNDCGVCICEECMDLMWKNIKNATITYICTAKKEDIEALKDVEIEERWEDE